MTDSIIENKYNFIPAISIVTVNYNNKTGLEQTIVSVLSQNSADFEFIIIDGGSTDESLDIIKNNNDNISYWVSEKDGGIYNAMNKGIARATGDYLVFLNSGDCFVNDSILSECLAVMTNNPLVDIFYGDVEVGNRAELMPYVHKHPAQLTIGFFADDTINHQASFIRSSLFTEFGSYLEQYKLASDYWFFLSCFIRGKVFQYLESTIVLYNFDGVSASNGFREYKGEQKTIWDKVVPAYTKSLFLDKERLLKENNDYKQLVSYKIVKIALNLNSGWQIFRKYFS